MLSMTCCLRVTPDYTISLELFIPEIYTWVLVVEFWWFFSSVFSLLFFSFFPHFVTNINTSGSGRFKTLAQ